MLFLGQRKESSGYQNIPALFKSVNSGDDYNAEVH